MDRTGGERDLWLEVQHELALRDGPPQLTGKPRAPQGLGFLFGTAAGALGYKWLGLWCLVLVLAELLTLMAWAARRV